jgi:hypothetical protein
MVVHIRLERDADLPQVGRARGAAGALTRLRHYRQQKCGQKAENDHDDEQLDESESRAGANQRTTDRRHGANLQTRVGES